MCLTLRVRPGGSGAVVWIEGEIDVCVADRLQELLLRIVRAHGPRLLLDLSAVSFLDCAGLRALVLTLRHAELCGWSVHLIAASAMVRRIITLIGAEDALPVRTKAGIAVAVLPASRKNRSTAWPVRPRFTPYSRLLRACAAGKARPAA